MNTRERRAVMAGLLILGSICLGSAQSEHLSMRIAFIAVAVLQFAACFLIFVEDLCDQEPEKPTHPAIRLVALAGVFFFAVTPLALDIYKNGAAWSWSSLAWLTSIPAGIGMGLMAKSISRKRRRANASEQVAPGDATTSE